VTLQSAKTINLLLGGKGHALHALSSCRVDGLAHFRDDTVPMTTHQVIIDDTHRLQVPLSMVFPTNWTRCLRSFAILSERVELGGTSLNVMNLFWIARPSTKDHL
jgi:hypothetical protein